MAVVEFARNILGLTDANSAEFNDTTKNPVIHIMENQKGITKKGGTMRLGSYPCTIKKGSLAYELYNKENIEERHRHRFEYNNDYKVAGQFHPEFKSRPDRPGPLFAGLIKAALENKNK